MTNRPTKLRIYVAGPYTKPDTTVNTRNALAVGERLMALGYIPFVPHLYHFWHFLFPHDYNFWMDLDDQWLGACNAVLRIPGESSGADAEVKQAKLLRIPVFYTVEELEASLKVVTVVPPNPDGSAVVMPKVEGDVLV